MNRLWHRFATGHWPAFQPFAFDLGRPVVICRICLIDAYRADVERTQHWPRKGF